MSENTQPESAAKVEEIAEQVVKVRYKLPMSASFNEVVAATIEILRPFIPSQSPAREVFNNVLTQARKEFGDSRHCTAKEAIDFIERKLAAPVTPVSHPSDKYNCPICRAEMYMLPATVHCPICEAKTTVNQVSGTRQTWYYDLLAPVSGNGPIEETKYLKLLRWFKLFYKFFQDDVKGKPSACASALAEDGELQEFIREANRIG